MGTICGNAGVQLNELPLRMRTAVEIVQDILK